MPRRGWTDVPTECRLCVGIVCRQNSGLWLPDTVPVDQRQRPGRGRPSQPVNRILTKVQSLAAALEALRPKDSTIAKAASTPAPQVQWTPDAAKETPVPETTGNYVHPLSDLMGPECTDSSNARRRAGVVRLVARQTHRSQGCPRIWDTERDSANDIHGGR